MVHQDLILCTNVYPGTSVETDAILLFESIRAFAGTLQDIPLWCFVPEYDKELTSSFKDRLHTLDVTIIPFNVEKPFRRFPFAADARAAALAETRARTLTELLLWLSANTIVLQEPRHFRIPENKHLAYRPVHHTLIGSVYNETVDRFWDKIYKHCHVPDDHIFPMTTHVDNNVIRPYFNAGILVTRPDDELLQSWYRTFLHLSQRDEFRGLYEYDKRYTVFMHQAVLSGVILSRYHREQLHELPSTYNYPLHLYDEDVTTHRPSTIEELVTVRHEGFYKDPEWLENMPAGKKLKTWLQTALGKSSND